QVTTIPSLSMHAPEPMMVNGWRASGTFRPTMATVARLIRSKTSRFFATDHLPSCRAIHAAICTARHDDEPHTPSGREPRAVAARTIDVTLTESLTPILREIKTV